MSAAAQSRGVLEGVGVNGGRVRPALGKLLKLAKSKPLGTVSAFIIIMMVFMAVFANVIAPYGPFARSGVRLLAPSWHHLMGTDELGRDVFTRVIYGSRVSLEVGLTAVIVVTGLGTVIGLVSGYFGGTFDLIVQRAVDVVQALPGLVLAMTIVTILGNDMIWVITAISVVIIPGRARVVRGAVLAAKNEVYVDAARAIGASNWRIMTKHIIPNVAAPIIILASLLFGGAILTEASLSFLGLGTQPPVPSWGGMLNGSGRTFMQIRPNLAFFPGMAISLAVLSFNLLGDTLRDVLDPRLRGR